MKAILTISSISMWLLLVFLLASTCKASSNNSSLSHDPQETLLPTGDALFDLVESKSQSQGNDEETFPPVRIAEYYAISWLAFMSFTPFDHDDSLLLFQLDDNNPNNLNHNVFWNPNNPFRLQLRLTCPKASRLVLGLVDDQGMPRTSSGNASTTNTNNNENGDLLSTMACGPPVDDMSRNILDCLGIPAVPERRGQSYQLAFQTNLEVTCLAYYDANLTSTTDAVSKTASGQEQEEQQEVNDESDNAGDNDHLGLIMSTPKQQIKSRTNLVLTESYYATKIINVKQYLNNEPVTNTYWNGERSFNPRAGTVNSFTDASSFKCQSGTKNADSDTCAAGQDSKDKLGFCTRQVTCYYSTPSKNGNCTSTIDPMVLTSARDINYNRQLQQDTTTIDDEGPKRMAKVEKNGSVEKPHQPVDVAKLRGHTDDKHMRKLSSGMFYHETRYRLLWTTINIGCDSYPLRMDVTCTNAASITYHNGGSPSNNATTDAVECYQSLFRANTLNCRRIIPNVLLDGTNSSNNEKTDYQPPLLSLDVQCTQLINQATDALPSVVTVDVYETANIRCHPGQPTGRMSLANQFSTFLLTPAVVGSAITILPVAAHRSTYDDDLDDDEADYFVTLPPLNGEHSFDSAIQGTCPLCQDGNAFYVNYNNSIGNKVAQLASGCQVVAFCSDHGFRQWTSKEDARGGTKEASGFSLTPRVCINAIPSTNMVFEDDAQFAAWIRPAETVSVAHQIGTLLVTTTLALFISLYSILF